MYLLDTNAYSAFSKQQEPVASTVSGEAEIALPLPAVAELRFGFVHGNQAEKNELRLQEFLAKPGVRLLLPTLETTRHYAEIQQHCRVRGRVLSDNDIWIAALTRESGYTLLTFDRDFEGLSEVLYERVRILEHLQG